LIPSTGITRWGSICAWKKPRKNHRIDRSTGAAVANPIEGNTRADCGSRNAGLCPPPSISGAIAEARALADAATTLAELEEAVRGFTGCALKKARPTPYSRRACPTVA